MPDRDWERTLHEKSFDLPEETWQRMENDLRGWLARSRREAEAPAAIPWTDRIRGWLPTRAWGASGALALGVLALGALLWTSSARSGFARFSWLPGQALDARGPANWNWSAKRCRIEGLDARLVLAKDSGGAVDIHLERGEATFHVEHRRSDESFTVAMGDCKVHVVGTVFTVGADSLRPWVRVQEGRIRMEQSAGNTFVEGGKAAACREPTGRFVLQTALPAIHLADHTPAPTSRQDLGRKAPDASDSVQVPSCREGVACIRILSEFVRIHPRHPAAPEVALRWARLASKSGDSRDALVAYAIASTSSAQADIAHLESLRLRVEHLSQEREVADSLDQWTGKLREGTPIWKEAWTLRADVARRLGDVAAAKRAKDILQAPSTAESGGR